jgi:NTE family protein
MTTAYKPEHERHGKALCLSGGGFRAALFHLGALRRLNEVGLLSKMDTISSVSGGSVANGLLAKVWPSLTPDASGTFTNFVEVYEAPLRAFCSRDIRTGPLLTDRLAPQNWWGLAGRDRSATDLLAQEYRDNLVGDLRLRDLKAIRDEHGPDFIFDASNLQTGVNFVFSGERVGDYQIGHAEAPDVLVADAIAASSCFPIAFPPLVLTLQPAAFSGGDLAKRNPPPAGLDDMRRRVVLSDGGVYDNLGLEPVWKSHQLVLCSDGGKPFSLDADPGTVIWSRLLRCQDVIGNQALAVRKRWLVSSLVDHVYDGAYWGIGTEIGGYPTHEPGYDGVVLDRLRAVRTDLDAFSEPEQLVLMNHGWLLADAAVRSYLPSTLLPHPIPSGAVPDAGLLDPSAATAALATSDRRVILGRGLGGPPAKLRRRY